jgi:hypothetical protein
MSADTNSLARVGIPSYGRRKRILEMYFVRFFNALLLALCGRSGNQRLVSEGTAIQKRDLERDWGSMLRWWGVGRDGFGRRGAWVEG